MPVSSARCFAAATASARSTPLLDDGRAERPARIDLRDRRADRDEDLARHAEVACREGQRLRVVAGAAGRDPARRRVAERRRPCSVAPRILNAPVRCRFSAFSTTLPPMSPDSVSELITGVRLAISAITSRASADVVEVGCHDRTVVPVASAMVPRRERARRRPVAGQSCSGSGCSGSLRTRARRRRRAGIIERISSSLPKQSSRSLGLEHAAVARVRDHVGAAVQGEHRDVALAAGRTRRASCRRSRRPSCTSSSATP